MTSRHDPPTDTGHGTIGIEQRRRHVRAILEAVEDLDLEEARQSSPDHEKGARTVAEELDGATAISDALEAEGAEQFHLFEKRVKELDQELRNFANATRQLGSSVGLMSSASRLRRLLQQLQTMFHYNAAEVFPRMIKKPPPPLKDRASQKQRQRAHRFHLQIIKFSRKTPHLVSSLAQNSTDPERIPHLFEQIVKELGKFLEHLNEFPMFSDDAVNSSIISFEGDLKYWASTLSEFKGQLKYHAVGKYLHDLSSEMGDHLDHITQTLAIFVEVSVPNIRFSQKHGTESLLNLSAVATFFSAVTATTLQFSFQDKGTPISDAVNCFFFVSLVLSIASSVNSIIGVTWRQAIYRSPQHRVPWWVIIWIKQTPLFFLVISVVAFFTGLVLFANSSGQALVTQLVTFAFTGLTCLGLIAVSAWFFSERLIYGRHAGERWLSDVVEQSFRDLWRFIGIGRLVRAIGRLLLSCCRRRKSAPPPLPIARENTESPHSPSKGDPSAEKPNFVLHIEDVDAPKAANLSIGSTATLVRANSKRSINEPRKSNLEARARWQRAMQLVLYSRGSSSQLRRPSIYPNLTSAAFTPSGAIQVTNNAAETAAASHQQSPAVQAANALRNLKHMQDISAHSALVRHMEFSHNGRWLATCSWDRTTCIFKVIKGPIPAGEDRRVLQLEPVKRLFHPAGLASQVAWCPEGFMLLTKLTNCIKVWTVAGICLASIQRKRTVQTVAWFPKDDRGKSDVFISIEESSGFIFDIHGKMISSFDFGRLHFLGVCVLPDRKRFLGVAKLTTSETGLKPVKSRPENRIVVYNMETKCIETQVPLLNEVRDIKLSTHSGDMALVSYEGHTLPQLWKVTSLRNGSRLNLSRTYYSTNQNIRWDGFAYFVGGKDQLVFCASKGGDVHIWARDSGRQLSKFRDTTMRAKLGSMAICWRLLNPIDELAKDHLGSAHSKSKKKEDKDDGHTSLMLALGLHDGNVKVWCVPMPQEDFDEKDGKELGDEDVDKDDEPLDGGILDHSSDAEVDIVDNGSSQEGEDEEEDDSARSITTTDHHSISANSSHTARSTSSSVQWSFSLSYPGQLISRMPTSIGRLGEKMKHSFRPKKGKKDKESKRGKGKKKRKDQDTATGQKDGNGSEVESVGDEMQEADRSLTMGEEESVIAGPSSSSSAGPGLVREGMGVGLGASPLRRSFVPSKSG